MPTGRELRRIWRFMGPILSMLDRSTIDV